MKTKTRTYRTPDERRQEMGITPMAMNTFPARDTAIGRAYAALKDLNNATFRMREAVKTASETADINEDTLRLWSDRLETLREEIACSLNAITYK